MNYDVVIIGAGPAGLFAAYELITKNKDLKIALMDKGQKVKTRFCPMNKYKTECVNCNPCRILSGYGELEHFLMVSLILFQDWVKVICLNI